MNEVVWVALISAGGAVAVALMTQFLSTRAASKSADHADKREALQWRRNEALRLEELQRKEAQEALAWERADALRTLELRDARLRELWGYVLAVRWQVLDSLNRVPVQGRPASKAAGVSAEGLPAHAAGQAYSVALIGLASVRPSAKAFYLATSRVQHALGIADQEAMRDVVDEWTDAYKALETSVAALSDGRVDTGEVVR